MLERADLLRHGEPVGGRKYRGQIDDPLSDKGWNEMRNATAKRHDWDASWIFERTAGVTVHNGGSSHFDRPQCGFVSCAFARRIDTSHREACLQTASSEPFQTCTDYEVPCGCNSCRFDSHKLACGVKRFGKRHYRVCGVDGIRSHVSTKRRGLLARDDSVRVVRIELRLLVSASGTVVPVGVPNIIVIGIEIGLQSQ